MLPTPPRPMRKFEPDIERDRKLLMAIYEPGGGLATVERVASTMPEFEDGPHLLVDHAAFLMENRHYAQSVAGMVFAQLKREGRAPDDLRAIEDTIRSGQDDDQ